MPRLQSDQVVLKEPKLKGPRRDRDDSGAVKRWKIRMKYSRAQQQKPKLSADFARNGAGFEFDLDSGEVYKEMLSEQYLVSTMSKKWRSLTGGFGSHFFFLSWRVPEGYRHGHKLYLHSSTTYLCGFQRSNPHTLRFFGRRLRG